MDILGYNRKAWDWQVEHGNMWTIPVSPEQVALARGGEWTILLTPTKPVPASWFPPLTGKDVLCLASGGGQQGPILAAAGGRVTVFDNSPRQLAQDRSVAERDGLDLVTVQGDMADLSAFQGSSFDLIVHPVSNVFAPDVRPVWKEAFRVLRPGGVLLAGITNPVVYIFDANLADQGELQVRYSLPYSDLEQLPKDRLQEYMETGQPVEFSHTLEDQIGGQLEAGFLLAGFFEDYDPESAYARYMPTFIATRAIKPTG